MPKNRGENASGEVRFPKLKKVELNDRQKELVSLKVIEMKKMGYDPIGCSRSIRL